jgi:transposase
LLDALNNNYNTNNSTLDDQYNAVLKALGLNLDDTTNLLDSRLKAAQDALEEQRRRSLQEAYISRMMNQRSLRDQLAASGLTGGATETVLANLLNNYQNSRNNIERDTQTNLRELLQTYLENMSEARQKYNSGVADAENYRANARQNLANSLLNQQQSIANSRVSAIQSLANSLLNQQQNALNYYQNNRAGAWDDLFNTVAKMYLANM